MKQLRYFSIATMLMVAIGFTACQTKAPAVVSAATNQYRNGDVIWRELVTPNPEAAAKFYTSLFGWNVTVAVEGKSPYWLITQNGTPIGGIVQMPSSVRNATGEWICSVSVPDVESLVSAATANGASTIYKPTDVAGRGVTAIIRDPQGAPLAFLRTSTGDPVKADVAENGWLWQELWSTNVAASEIFYTNVFGAQINRKKDDNRDYSLITNKEGRNMAGIVKSPVEGVRSHWMNYVKVSDPAAMVKKAESLGARVLLAPSSNVRNGTLGIILDPTGAAIALQKVN